MYRKFTKRMFDIVLTLLALLVLSPVYIIIAVLIKMESRGPVFFRQDRLGYKAKTFKIYKFRSMFVGSEKTGSGVYSRKGDPRVTRIGRFIRFTSIDELPQLFNILKGEMSIVGPRPPLTYHPWPLEQYAAEQMRMFDTRPGITGWAQVNGRKNTEWNTRIGLSVWYVDHASFTLDAKIFFMTVFNVLTSANNHNSETATAPAAVSEAIQGKEVQSADLQ